MRHTIDLDEMLKWIEDGAGSYVTYASSWPKRLDIKLTGGYRVTNGFDVVYFGTDGRSAVDAYNSI